MVDASFEKFMRCAKVCGLFFLIDFSDAAGQAKFDHMVTFKP